MLVGGVGGRVGHGVVWAPWRRLGWMGSADRDARRDEVGEGHRVEGAGDGVADADPQDVDGAARRAIAQRRVLRVVAGAQHRGDRALEGAQDVGHRDRLGRSGELVAAVRAAGARHETGLAQADDELLEVGAREVLLGGDLGEATPGPFRGAARAGPSGGRRTRPSWRRRWRRCRGRRAGGRRGRDGGRGSGQGNGPRYPSDFVGYESTRRPAGASIGEAAAGSRTTTAVWDRRVE